MAWHYSRAKYPVYLEQADTIKHFQGNNLDESSQDALAVVAQWIERGLLTKGSPVRFLVRTHAWVVGQFPAGGSWETTTH